MRNEPIIMDDWENMLHFGLALVNQAKKHLGDNITLDDGFNIVRERIAILHLDHATELFMKAFLDKIGYTILFLDKNDVRKGLLKDDLIAKSKSIDFTDCLSIISKKLNIESSDYEKLMKFHALRNEIQHRAIDIKLNKLEQINIYYPSLEKLYGLMFPGYIEGFPKFD